MKAITMTDEIEVRDCHGALLANGDSVRLIKDLKVKGSSVTLKRGTVVKGIRLTDDPEEIDCRTDKVKGLVLRTEFVKKV
jgi:protein PhnA